MPYFNRFDICEAYMVMEWDYNCSGILQERESNQRRRMSTDFQLNRMQFKPAPSIRGFESLEENGRDIYKELERRYGFITDTELEAYYNLERGV